MARTAAALERYRAKRDFSKTAEPPPKLARKAGWSFVVQKHAARRLHYDFRLELDGVLKSWAVTKGPSLDPNDKRLAVHVEDHPLDYGGFEGTIPKGEYGGGTVMLWDRGTWEPIGDPNAGLKKGHLKFRLQGERLSGAFDLVRMKPRAGEKADNWLLIKERDDAASDDFSLEAFGRSVSTGRTMEEIATGNSRVWSGKTGELPPQKAAPKPASSKTQKGSAKSAKNLPPFVAPQLATLVDAPPNGAQWRHELKYDGYRILAAVSGGAVRLYSRNGLDWTDRFSAVAEELAALPVKSMLLDGEAVVLDEKGRSSFSGLQQALTEGSSNITYIAFDILERDGKDLKNKTLAERTEVLESIVPKQGEHIMLGGYLTGDADQIFKAACRMGAEGIVSKRLDQPYRSTRSQSWLKTKCVATDEFVIIGYRPSDKAGRSFASILVGEYDGNRLVYRGRVGTGFTEERLKLLGARFKALATATPPAEGVPREILRHAKWVKPELVAQVGYAERTREGILRHGRFEGLREDKPAKEVKTQRPKKVRRA